MAEIFTNVPREAFDAMRDLLKRLDPDRQDDASDIEITQGDRTLRISTHAGGHHLVVIQRP